MNITYLALNDENWDNKLSLCKHDVYHTRDWLKISELSDKGEAFAICIEDKEDICFFPFIRKKIDANFWDAFSPYGYGGPIYNLNFNLSKIDIFLTHLIEYLSQTGCVSCFFRLHPILNTSWESKIGLIVKHGNTISVDLTKNINEHWAETRKGHRSDIKNAIKSGVTVNLFNGYELNEKYINSFYEMYQETMQHVCASDYYFFNKEYFHLLFDTLKNKVLLAVAFLDQKIIAGSIFTLCNSAKIIQYHLSATKEEYRNLQPSKLILHEMRTWGNVNNYSLLHLGGGLGAQEDSLFNFKHGFSKQLSQFNSHRIIVNNEIFDSLCKKCNTNIDLKVFFPPYR